jgi:hypothetical protein
LKDDKVSFLATVVLSVGVDERKHEGLCEDVGTKDKTTRHLFRLSACCQSECKSSNQAIGLLSEKNVGSSNRHPRFDES